jgi:hypothetical protein
MIKFNKFIKTNNVTFFSYYKLKADKSNDKDVKIFNQLHLFIQKALSKFEDVFDEKTNTNNNFLYAQIVKKIWYSDLTTDNKIRMIDYYDFNSYIPVDILEEYGNAWRDLVKRMEKSNSKQKESVSVTCDFCNQTTRCIVQ